MTTYVGQDAEYLIFPIVEYNIDAYAAFPSNVCQYNPATVAYSGHSAEILNSRFFNLH